MRSGNHGLSWRRFTLRVVRAALAIPLLVGAVRTQQASAQERGGLSLKAVRQIEELLAAKAQRTPAQRKVSSQLLDAAGESIDVRRQAKGAALADEQVMVDIRADVLPAVLSRIQSLGGTVINSVPKYRAIRARLPIAAVEKLAALDAVQSIRPAELAFTRDRPARLPTDDRPGTLESVVTRVVDTSEGDVAHRANVARSTHGVDGTGIGVGVISDGVATLADQQATGDVPSRVTVLHEQEGGAISYRCGGTSVGSEGTAMLEIVHDLAPGAELFFATGINGSAQMAQNIEDLCAAGADIIVDDIGYPATSVFQDDVISQAVSAAVADGCYYFSSAGNGGNKNDGTAGVWEGDFAAGSTLTVNGVAVGTTHDFGGGVIRNRIKRNSTSSIYLLWADPEGGSANDYDLFLVDADDNVLDSSTNTQDGTQDPFERIRGSCSDDLEDNRLIIVKTTSAADRYLRLEYAPRGLEITTAGHTFGHSASEDAIGVAAVDVGDAGGSGGVFNGTESVEGFSSDGPRRIFFEPDGTPITAGNFSSTGGKLLQKPDLAAANCVSTSTPGFSTFCGTSAAAPHAAAIAALMLEAAGGPGNVTQSALSTAMTGAAIDIEATGVDRDSGAGIVMVPGAVDAVDVAAANRNQAPKAEGMLADRTILRGAAAVMVNFASAFSEPDNETLTYNAISSDTDRVTVTLTGSQLTLTPGLPGFAEVAVRATDPSGLSAVLTFLVTVASTAPSAPRNLTAVGGDRQVVLSWEPPLRDGGADITDYEYRVDRMNPWVSTGSSDTTYTVSGLVNGTTYLFEVRAVNSAGKSFPSNRVEATPTAPEPQVFTLDFPHFANGGGGGITSEVVLLNAGATAIRPVLYFSDRQGKPLAAESVVEVTDDLEVQQDDGGLTVRTAIEPLGELTVATHGRGEEVSGSVRVVVEGAPIGGVLRYGVPRVGVTGVGAGMAVGDALFPARRQQGGIRTAAALHNLGEEAIEVSCELMSGGAVLEEAAISLEPNGQASWFLEDEFTMTDTTDFTGTVRCRAPREGSQGTRFTGLAVEVDAANRIFTTLPVVPLERTAGEGGATVLYFAHFANGGNPEGEGIRSELVFVNVQTEASRPVPTPFHRDIPASRPVIYFYDREGQRIGPASVVDVTDDLEVTDDDGLTVRTVMEPLGELTVATHGRGEEVSGSVKVVSEGAIGGVLRYSVPEVGVTGVGAGPAVRDALFPARRNAGGIRTAAAMRNLGEEAMQVTCWLMSGGAVLEETEIPLAGKGQMSWFIEDEFTATDTTDFAGTVRCRAPGEGEYTGLAVEVDGANRIFTTLPVVPVEERMAQP